MITLAGCEAKAATPSHRWPKEALELAATLPLQEGGRVMPLATFAEYTLLTWDGRRSVRYERDGGRYAKGDKLSAVEAFLDVMFRPDVAKQHPLFVVDNDEVLDAVGIAHDRRNKRDRYSLEELWSAVPQLSALAESYRTKSAASRSSVESGVIALDDHIDSYLRVRGSFTFAQPYAAPASRPELLELFPNLGSLEVVEVAKRYASLAEEAEKGETEKAKAAMWLVVNLEERALVSEDGHRVERALRVVPPIGDRARDPLWLTPAAIVQGLATSRSVPPAHVAILTAFSRCAASADDPSRAVEPLRDLHKQVAALAGARGEYDKIGLEVGLANLAPFSRALIGYLLAFLLAAATWLWRSRGLRIAAWSILLLSLALHIAGIVIRCVIRERPPMLNLYDTTLFISAFVVASACVIELVTRMRVAFALAPLAGALLLLVSQGYETVTADDTMRPPIAVLDTNFWLATHVVCIAIGYSASLAASLFAHVHVLGRVFGWKRGDPAFYPGVARMGYGVLCFALLFSLVGTILGGIWANESWGRFWGWDPKENGALLICLVQLATLHARMGGLLRPLGIAIATIFCGMVVAFSWWGVNLLGVGLHAYGFTQGLWTWLIGFWVFEALVIGAGWWRAVKDAEERARAASGS